MIYNHNDVLHALRKHLKSPRIALLRVENSYHLGMPDLLILIPGKTYYIEIKHKSDKLNHNQKVWWTMALKLKQTCFILQFDTCEMKLFWPIGVEKNQWGNPVWSLDSEIALSKYILSFNE